MKTTFIRALAIAMLATSAFAVTNDGKSADAASPCANSKPEATQETNQSKKDRKSNKKQNDQQKENNDPLFAIYG